MVPLLMISTMKNNIHACDFSVQQAYIAAALDTMLSTVDFAYCVGFIVQAIQTSDPQPLHVCLQSYDGAQPQPSTPTPSSPASKADRKKQMLLDLVSAPKQASMGLNINLTLLPPAQPCSTVHSLQLA